MTNHVHDILAEASAKRLTPVEIVMGDHWGEISLGSSMRLSLLRHIRNLQKNGGGGNANRSRMRVSAAVMSPSPQAMVKVIRKGGTASARGMRDQLSYLEKDGDAKLERSERYFGSQIDADAQENLIEAWGLAGDNKTGSDKTTHIVVSFPSDTDHGAAYRAGRSWAAEMFASGTYGDVFDYYTAFHTDKAHPHIHVIVNRRGMENGDWLKVSRRSQFNYDEFRAVQVEVAAREGIKLAASPRLARGISDRPMPEAEIRGAEKEKRAAKPPTHTPVTAIRTAATLLSYSHQMNADAKLLEEAYPVLAKTMRSVAMAIKEGRAIYPGQIPNKHRLTFKEARERSEFIMSRRSEILDGIKEIDAEIETIPKSEDRASLERVASRLKADAADLMPDVVELQDHRVGNANGYYRGIRAVDGREKDIKGLADRKVGELASSVGIDPAKFTSRYEGPEPVSSALSDQWRKDELEDIQRNLTYRAATPADNQEQLAQAAYDDLHRNALQTYRKAERDLEAHAARKRELHRIAKMIREGRRLDTNTEVSLTKSVKETLHVDELRQLEAGRPEAFRHATNNIDEQRVLSRQYLEAEIETADGARKRQLTTALTKIANDTRRDADLAAQENTLAVQKDRGLDR